MIIVGFRGRSKVLGMARLRCPRCGQEALHQVERYQRWFSLFFAPVLPLGSRFMATCTWCGLTRRIDAQAARGAEPTYSGLWGSPPPPPP